MPESDQKSETRALTAVTMSGSRWAVATYGIVEFLRTHRAWRFVVAVLGIASGLVLLPTLVGLLKIPGLGFPENIIALVLVPPWLLWIATVSGPSFKLEFPAAQASKERQIAEEQFEESDKPEDALELDLKRLNEYYAINQAQARSSFRWAVFSMLVGFGTIVSGIWLFYFRSAQPDKLMAGLSTAAGCVVNVISGLFLYLHSKTQDRSLHYYEQLARLQKLSIAMRLVDAHQDSDKKTEARNLLIQELIATLK
jgi:hypothetical protein